MSNKADPGNLEQALAYVAEHGFGDNVDADDTIEQAARTLQSVSEALAGLQKVIDAKEKGLDKFRDEEGDVKESDFPDYDEERADWNEDIVHWAELVAGALSHKETT